MPRPIPVGRSTKRTEAKHDYLNRTLGREMGAASRPKLRQRLAVPYQRHILVDLTAGDGVPYEDEGPWPQSTSAGIFARHGRYEATPVPVEILLCERAPATFASLVERLEANLLDIGYWPAGVSRWTSQMGRVVLEARCQDSRELPCPWGEGDFVFLNNDPNKIHDWALPDALQAAAARGAVIRSFNTMGCNVGGMMRLVYEGGRDRWYGHIAQAVGAMRPHQDLTLLKIDRDASKWAYLVNEPTAWVGEDIAQAKSIFSRYGMAVTAVSFRDDHVRFRSMLDELFRQAKEREQREGGDGDGQLR